MSASDTQQSSSSLPSSSTPPPPALPAARPVREDDKESERLCNQWVESGLTKNPAIQFLLQQLMDLNCVPPDRFIQCRQCEKPSAGGFGMVESASPCGKPMRDFQQVLEAQKQAGGTAAGATPVKIQPETSAGIISADRVSRPVSRSPTGNPGFRRVVGKGASPSGNLLRCPG